MRQISRRLSAFVLSGALCLFPSSSALAFGPAKPAAASRDVQHNMAQKIAVRGVANFGEVTPQLYRGAQPSQEGFKSLAKMGIGIVVDLRDGGQPRWEEKEVTAAGMQFISIPWECSHPKDDYFVKFLAILHNNPDRKVFVHCHAGVDRTGMMVASYRMAEQGWTSDEALHEMKAFGFSPFHQLICYGLESYEERFPTVVNSSQAFGNSRVAQDKPVPSAAGKP
jgi:protein tyrosine/serine phosphatase